MGVPKAMAIGVPARAMVTSRPRCSGPPGGWRIRRGYPGSPARMPATKHAIRVSAKGEVPTTRLVTEPGFEAGVRMVAGGGF